MTVKKDIENEQNIKRTLTSSYLYVETNSLFLFFAYGGSGKLTKNFKQV